MARAKLVLVALLLMVPILSSEVTAQVSKVDSPSWVTDLKTLGYRVRPSDNFSKTFGTPPTTLAFADADHLVATFISSDPVTRSGQEGKSYPFKLRLYAMVFDAKTGKVETRRDWPTPYPNDGVVAAHKGRVVMRAGDRLTLYTTSLEALKEIDTAPNHAKNEGLFQIFTSPTGRFVLLEFLRGRGRKYTWMDADNLEMIRSFSDDFFPLSISDKEILGLRRTTPREFQLVIRKPEESEGRVIPLSKYRWKDAVFVNQGTFVIGGGYSSMSLIRADGTLMETIQPDRHYFSERVTPSADGQRFAFTGASIRNVLEILSPHQQWEYVKRVIVYDISAHTFIFSVKVRHSARDQEFPLALSPNGSMLAFLDGESLKLYQLPVAAQPHP
jgi:hypothetical protein